MNDDNSKDNNSSNNNRMCFQTFSSFKTFLCDHKGWTFTNKWDSPQVTEVEFCKQTFKYCGICGKIWQQCNPGAGCR